MKMRLELQRFARYHNLDLMLGDAEKRKEEEEEEEEEEEKMRASGIGEYTYSPLCFSPLCLSPFSVTPHSLSRLTAPHFASFFSENEEISIVV